MYGLDKTTRTLVSFACVAVLFTGTSAATRAESPPTWMQRDDGSGGPPDMHWPAMAFDSANNVTWVFGGHLEGSSPYTNIMWKWDGNTWTEVFPDQRPPARDAIVMVYDAARGVCVLFGGYGPTGSPVLGDTWEWDGTNWTQKCPCDPQPSPRAFHAMAYDASRQVVVLFGGWDGTNRLNDTWEWDGSTWTEVTPAAPAASPFPRQEFDMAYDSERCMVLLFGGSSDGYDSYGDTWIWDGTAWIDVTPSDPEVSPPARQAHGMVFDSDRGVAVLFGGHGGDASGDYDDIWEWDGTSWTEVIPSMAPPSRHAFDMVYDASRHAVVLFAGHPGGGADYYGDTWEYAPDCNDNAIPDTQDLMQCDGSAACGDCNFNGAPDSCDIESSMSQDCQPNGIPDECEVAPLNTAPVAPALETLTVWAVQSGGTTSLITLEAGTTYWLLAEGTCSVGYSGQQNDAEWWRTPGSCPYPEWSEYADFFSYPPHTMDLVVDGAGYDWWGSSELEPDPVGAFETYAPHVFSEGHHSYWIPIVGTGTPINVRLVDHPSHYHDNTGSIEVSIFASTGPLTDCDGDFILDECELDSDNDGIIDDCDNCPDAYNPEQADCDGDGVGDVCDDDIDGDGVPNVSDVCPRTPFCDVMPDGRPRLDVNNDCNENGEDIHGIVQRLLEGCSECE